LKKIYNAIINFIIQYEKPKFFGFATDVYEISANVEFPYIIYALDKKGAEREVAMSEFYKTETLSEHAEHAYNLSGLNFLLDKKSIKIEEATFVSFSTVMETMKPNDFMDYVLDYIHNHKIENGIGA
jgi:hypothetical protein